LILQVFLEVGLWVADIFWGKVMQQNLHVVLWNALSRKYGFLTYNQLLIGEQGSIAAMHKIGFQQKMSGFLGDYLRYLKYLPIVKF